MQSAAVVHAFVHAPAEQRPGAQLVGAGAIQEPIPLHADAAIREKPSVLQVAASHVVLLPTLAQARPAAQDPVFVMQTGVAAAVEHSGSRVPTAFSVQVPSWPALLQASHVPVQALLQQTPSAHDRPVLQSLVTVHVCPWARLVPHVLVIVLQVTPTQSAFDEHVVAHWNGLVASHLL